MEKAFSSGLSSALAGGADTIVARSSPAGRGGLALIRVSGGETRRLAGTVCPGLNMDRGWRASLVELLDPAGGLIDRAVALPYPAPKEHQPTLKIRSKWDLAEDEIVSAPWRALSCETGDGLDELRFVLAELVAADIVDLGGEVAIAERHRRALELAVSELEATDFELPELAAEGVRAALVAARELTGEVVTEDVLDRVFGSFCVGK